MKKSTPKAALLERIESSLKGFAHSDTAQSARQLFDALGYQTSGYSEAALDKKIFIQTFPHFEPLSHERSPRFAKSLYPEWLNVQYAFQLRGSELGLHVGKQDNVEIHSYICLSIELSKDKYSKAALAEASREINKCSPQPLLILFKHGDAITISIAQRHVSTKDESKDIITDLTLIKDIQIKEPHRIHTELLSDLDFDSIREKNQVEHIIDLHKIWCKLLDNNTLNKKFYSAIANWYFWAIANVKFPYEYLRFEEKYRNDYSDEALQQIANEIAVIRLLTRLIFVWFLKEKGLVPNELFQADKLQELITNFNETAESNNFYKAILQNLFFATLNRPNYGESKRQFAEEGNFITQRKQYHLKNLFRYANLFKKDQSEILELFSTIPFLNGGLFDCLDVEKVRDGDSDAQDKLLDWQGKKLYYVVDGFSRKAKNQPIVPDFLFFGEPREFTQLNQTYNTANKKYAVQGIINILQQYKFTVEEDTPLEQEIALNPVLLGNIFENLLAYYNPETSNAARNHLGAFYTPSEIVNYMVDESLLAYFVQYFSDNKKVIIKSLGSAQSDILYSVASQTTPVAELPPVPHDLENRLRLLMDYTHPHNPFADQDESETLVRALFECKILDPACGSGAYPMGILQKMVYILRKLDPTNQIFHTQIVNKRKAQFQPEIDRLELELNAIEADKQIIQQMRTPVRSKDDVLRELDQAKHNLENAQKAIERNFSVTHNEADYARKLYLIENCLYGADIQPVAVQITKLRFFISLIIEQKADPNLDNLGILPLPNLETKFVAANALSMLHAPIDLFQKNAADIEKNIKENRALHFIASNRTQKNELEKDFYRLKIQRQNLFTQEITQKANDIQELIKHKTATLELSYSSLKNTEKKIQQNKNDKKTQKDLKTLKDSITKFEKELAELQKQLAFNETFNADIQQFVNYDPYNPNIAASFFDANLMFGLSDGFDIVIGNPPYVQIQKLNKKDQALLEKQQYKTYTRTGDLYCIFYERSMQLLKNNGFLAFITSNTWMRTNYGESLRKYFIEHTQPLVLVDFSNNQIFDSATVNTNILITQKADYKEPTRTCVVRGDFKEISKTRLNNLGVYIRQHQHPIHFATFTGGWVVLPANEYRIKQKIEALGTPLKNWDIQIYRGVLTGFNDAFIIDKATRDALIEADPQCDKIIRPLLRGRDIKKWKPDFADLFLIGLQFGWTNTNRQMHEPEAFFKQTYPAIYEHLKKKGDDFIKQKSSSSKEKGLYNRDDKGEFWWELRSCNYWNDFYKDKIIYPNMTKYMPFIYDNKQFFTNQKCFIITGRCLKYLVAFLNSAIFKICFRDNFPELQGGTRELSKIFFDKIPVKQITIEQEKQFSVIVDELTHGNLTTENRKRYETQIEQLLFDIYSLTPEEQAFIQSFVFDENDEFIDND